ncbi:MAG: hypothetical protein COV67_01610, partial [Nitrospinae bacterium CG11_big_fil_rev_8_21_14_0_20_56_8]
AYRNSIANFDRESEKTIPAYIQDAYFKLGINYHGNRQYPEAIQALQSAIQLFPDNPMKGWAEFLLAESFEKLKDANQAESQLAALSKAQEADEIMKKLAESRLNVLNWQKEFNRKL